ncbi:MAG TPA: DUF835 domain-containing protein [Thermoplasmata archaeon]|nr:DUF835 domain-containing protein [Thermoplasmata archaeon]
MNDRDRSASDDQADEEPRADEEYARTYAAGYEEGIRSALREILQHTARGHTAQELRILAESRLARLSEEVELKRKSVLGPPRRPAWNALLRAPQPGRPAGASLAGALSSGVRLAPGRSVLVREERPARALDVVREHASAFPRVVIVSVRPGEVAGVPAERRLEIPIGSSGGAGTISPGEIGGRLKEPLEAGGGALVYVDGLEFLASEYSFDTTLKFVSWLVGRVEETGSALVVSFDRRSLDLREMSRLERAFPSLA